MPIKRVKVHAQSETHLKARSQKEKSRKAAADASAKADGSSASMIASGSVQSLADILAHPVTGKNESDFFAYLTSSRQFPDLAPPENNGMNSPEPSNLDWSDSAGQHIFFTAGSPETDYLAESLVRALRGAYNDETVGEAEYSNDSHEQDPLFCPDDENISAADLNIRLFGPDSKSDWFPYPDKACLSPRLRFSRAQQQAVLSWAKDLGADVPSYTKFRKTQDIILEEVGDPTTRHESSRGNDAGNKLGEVWHGEKMMRDTPDHLLSPNICHNGKMYYVNELVQRTDGSWFLPKRWVTRNNGKVMLASGYNNTRSAVSTFEQNFEEILNTTSGIYPLAGFVLVKKLYIPEMPHPLHVVAGSKLIYSIPLVIFIDDVSGNKSKQWNKHFFMLHLENEFHVRFVATSPFASPLEIMQGVRASIEETFTEPVPAWDCETKEEVLFRSYGLLFSGDNPMQAELCSCAGLNSNFFCRTCGAGGTREWKQSNKGFANILKPGVTRKPEDTAEETFQQILTALEPNIATTLTEAVRASGVKDALAQPIIDMLVKMGQDLRKANPNGSSFSPDEVQMILTEELKKHQQVGAGITNPLFDMDGIDMHKDTPTEILHTILLGVVKYYWGQTIWILEKGQDFPLFQARLNSLVSDGLNVPKIQADYMCQYKGGLIGKHFKTLSQIMAFAVQAWLILGRLTVLLWHTEIVDFDSYTAELESCIDDFINITCKCSPSILISKPKFHFLLHLPFFIRRFGPAVLFSTERYEAYNAVFRACSIYSNRLTPSRDIAWSFAGIDRVKHVVTGGWWKDSRTETWTCANPRILRHILDHPEMGGDVDREPGTILLYPKRKLGEVTPERKFFWHESLAAQTKSARFSTGVDQLYKTAHGLVAGTGDKILVGQNVIVREEGGSFSPLVFGIVREIILPIDSTPTYTNLFH
ncbi:hypothetical protein B0H14DRAFT_3102396 [Mycena olivaceomarginata]|nr:hypothetical protein B0H14DRAFT_3102396 [Mycena olivaceomarginata]